MQASVTVLIVSVKAFTKALLRACEPYDQNPDEAMLGFRRGSQCAELISATRLLVERSLEWQIPLVFSHRTNLQKHGVLSCIWPFGAVYDAGVCRKSCSRLCFLQGSWSTTPIRPAIGLRQGCSLSPWSSGGRYKCHGDSAARLESGAMESTLRVWFALHCTGRRHLAYRGVTGGIKNNDQIIKRSGPDRSGWSLGSASARGPR